MPSVQIQLRKLRAGLTTLGVVIGIAAIVALLSISQGLQDAITEQLQTGFATDTLIVSTGGVFGPGAGGQMGAPDSGFSLLVNDTQTIDELGNISISVAVIQKACYIKSGEREFMRYVVGVDFAKYANVYSSTFEAENGEISLIPENEMVVVGKRVSDPWDNGTSFCNVNDSVEIVWINGTVRPRKNETEKMKLILAMSRLFLRRLEASASLGLRILVFTFQFLKLKASLEPMNVT